MTASPPPPPDSRPAARRDPRGPEARAAQPPPPNTGLADHREPQSSCSSVGSSGLFLGEKRDVRTRGGSRQLRVTVRTVSPRAEPTRGEGRGKRNAEQQGAINLRLGPEASGSPS